VSTAFVFFSWTLSTSTQRFLSVEMVREGGQDLWKVFSLNFWLYSILAGIVVIVGLALGPWLVYEVLNIPDDREFAALIVFYSMIVCLAITLIASVYESVLIARENMKVYAYIGIFDAVAKLAIAFIVTVAPEKLITYGLLMVVAMLLPKIFMVIYCFHCYPESHPRRFWNGKMLREMLGFTGWNLYGGTAWIVNDQSLSIAINIIFGPAMNAARAVAQQVNSAVFNFSNNFTVAMRPQLIKSYAAGDMDEERRLLSMGTRGAFYIMWILGLPIMLRIDYILSIWLTVIPDETSLFVVWTIIFLLVNSLHNPLHNVVHATGDLKKYSLWAINAYVLACPISIGLFCLGAPAWSMYIVMSVTRFISTIIPLYTLRPYITIRISDYLRNIIVPVVGVVIVSLGLAYGVNLFFPDTFLGLAGFGAVTLVMTLTVIAFVGLKRSERETILKKVFRFFK